MCHWDGKRGNYLTASSNIAEAIRNFTLLIGVVNEGISGGVYYLEHRRRYSSPR